MRKYQTPETMRLQVNAQTIICASGGAQAPSGKLGTMTVTEGVWV